MASNPPNGNGYARIGVWASAISAGALVIGAFIWIGTIASEVNNNSTNIAALAGRLGRIEADNRTLELRVTALETSQKEIETQFCGTGNIINLMHANDMRIQSLLWQKSYAGITLPTDNPFYPVLCNRNSNEH